MIIQHNLLASNATRQFNINIKRKSKNVEKLSSGYSVNRAADDAAGLSISEKMRKQIRGLNQAVDNAQDGISLIQVADGAMSSIQAMLHRSTELCVQAANDTLTEEDRDTIQKEINQILEEIDTISYKTRFNNRYLLKGDNALIIGAGDPPTIAGGMPPWGSIDSTSLSNGYMSSTYTDPNGDTHVATIIDFSGFTGSADDIADAVGTGFYTTCCTCQDHYSICFNDGYDSTSETSGNHFIANIGIGNATSADEIYQHIINATGQGNPNSHFTEMVVENGKLIVYDNRTNVTADPNYGLIGPGVARSSTDSTENRQGDLYLQLGANAGENLKISLPAVSTASMGLTSIDVSSHQSASSALDKIENAVIYVSGERSKMGAYQNRLEFTINNLENYSENLTDAESVIRDTDMATTMTQMAKDNILEQVSQAMISQANQNQQGVLSLLQ
ncbi:MAG: hypothetical protein E7258_05035 [Lachnospiraceae bacterium]|nr:hypothetical protein [Lachnospiraceae bacterium]